MNVIQCSTAVKKSNLLYIEQDISTRSVEIFISLYLDASERLAGAPEYGAEFWWLLFKAKLRKFE